MRKSVVSKYLLTIQIASCLLLSLSGCSFETYESPRTYGARAGEDGAKYFKENNPGLIASEESAAKYCGSMAEEGSKINNWTTEEIFEAGEWCSILFSTEMFRQ